MRAYGKAQGEKPKKGIFGENILLRRSKKQVLTLWGLSRNDVMRSDHAGVIVDLRGLTDNLTFSSKRQKAKVQVK